MNKKPKNLRDVPKEQRNEANILTTYFAERWKQQEKHSVLIWDEASEIQTKSGDALRLIKEIEKIMPIHKVKTIKPKKKLRLKIVPKSCDDYNTRSWEQ